MNNNNILKINDGDNFREFDITNCSEVNDFLTYNKQYEEIINEELYDFLEGIVFGDDYVEVSIGDNKYNIDCIHDEVTDNDHYYISKRDITRSYIGGYEFTNVDGDFINNGECFSDYDIYECDYCGEYHYGDRMTWLEDAERYVCEDCFEEHAYVCDYCGNYYERGNDEYCTEEGHIYCNSCGCDHAIYCDECDTYHDADFVEYNEEDDRYYCRNCLEELHRDLNFDTSGSDVIGTIEETEGISGAINGYHAYNRGFIKRQLDGENTKFYAGVELEIVNEGYSVDLNKAATYVRKNLNCVVAHDSSLSNGFEVISDPQTFAYWMSRKNKIAAVFKELTDNGFISDKSDCCGLHIHVSRDYIGETTAEQKETIARLELIIENFKDELKLFSRRRDYHYCQFLSDISRIELSTDDIKRKKDNAGERYQVINVNNSKTIEFRLFKGTLNITSFYAALQLVYNLIEVAKNNEYVGMTWLQLINRNDFEELKAYNTIRAIKTLKRVKDYTEKIKKLKIKEDKRINKLKEKQEAMLNEIRDAAYNSRNIIAYYQKFVENSIIQNILGNDERYKNVQELLRRLYSSSEDLKYTNTRDYYTADNVRVWYYDEISFEGYIKTIKELLSELNSLYKNEMEAE